VTTGAVSMGKHDFIKDALVDCGARIHYHKVAIRPGKPGLFAELPARALSPGPVVFGVPGNPVSTVVGLRFFIGPYLRALRGLSPERPRRAYLETATPKPNGLKCFFKARVTEKLDATSVRALAGQPSFMVSPLLKSNAWVVFPEQDSMVPEGTAVDVYALYPNEDSVDENESESEALRGLSSVRARCC
jgi:molybdopterin molybdotransferase